MKVVLYPRVSSKKQAQEGDSIDAQIRRLTEYCNEHKYEIVDVYTDSGKSASINDDKIDIKLISDFFNTKFNITKRPAFERLLREAKIGKFDGIVFYKWDRFSRSPIFSALARMYFERHNIKLIPTDDATDSLLIQIKELLGKEEMKVKNERVRLTRIQRFEKGMMVARPPFGYKINKKSKIMEIKPKEANIVKEIYNSIISGKSIVETAKNLNMGYQSVKNILNNKVYIGIIQFEGKEKQGIHKPLISKDIFYKCNEKIN